MTHLDNEKMYFPEDIFIITGMSDIDWERQTKNDMLNCIKDNVFHLGKIKQFNSIINTKRNIKILIIIDECQIATSKDQQIDKIFKDIEKSFKRLTEGVDDVSDKEAKSKFKDLEDKDLDNDGDADSSDKYLHKRLGKVALKTEEESDEELDEMSKYKQI